jgi:hypothetical protein
MIFVNRENELRILDERFKSGKAEFLVVYGRRRIGKTELIKKMISKHGGIILMGREESKKLQLQRFSRLLAEYFKDDFLKKQSFDSWDAFFEYVGAKSNRVILALDEFPYLVKEERALPSILQDYWDNKLRYTEIFLIILGSSVSMMEELLGYKSPLYGRRTGQLKLGPFKFKDVASYVGDIEKAVEFYSVFGGTPAYITEVDLSKGVMENIEEKFLRIDSFIYQDVRFVLMEEMEEPRYYFSILEAIAMGNVTLGGIVNYTGLRRSLVGKYLRVLIDLDLIKREIPVTASVKSKRGIYSFRDNIFSFWFGFVYPYEDMLQLGREEEVRYRIANNLNTYIGRVFEDVSEEFLRYAYKGRFSRLGRWWHRGEEIDLVALNERKKEISFFEVKWSRIGEREADRILRDLRQKASNVKWHNQDRRERYGIVAKEIADKEKLREREVLAYDLVDMAEMSESKPSKG